ncbi:MAG: T9SS type A sorting domain-containing protein [Saprospiraceae bacterium]|nr:T9SS type A sorting domain-containing protein [Saprospiraceae bacterium]
MRLLISILYILIFNYVLNSQSNSIIKYFDYTKKFEEVYSKTQKTIVKEIKKNHKRKKLKPSEIIEEDGDLQKLERWAWYWRDRLNEDGTFSNQSDQLTTYKQYRDATQYLRNTPIWKHEGPTQNSGGYWAMGRTTHVDFHPTNTNIFFVAAANGGLWKTVDAGLTYTSLGENLPQQPVGIVIIDPRNPNTIYITIGEKEGWWQYGLGVYKSTDGGINWKPTSLSYKLTENRVIYGLEMNPKNSNILIAASNKGIFRTTDGGITWSTIKTGDFSDVKFKTDNPDVVYVARNDYWGSCEVLKSTDGGLTFNQISNFNIQKNFIRLQVTPANPELLAVNASEDGKPKLYLSKNAGLSFEYISNLPENTIFFMSPTQEDVMYSGYVKVHKSYDGGYSWQEITSWWNDGKNPEVHADHHFVAYNKRANNELYFCNDGGIHRYEENLEQWTELSQNLPITQFYKMAISTNNPPALVGGSQDNGGWLKRSNGTWRNTNGGDAMWQLIDPSDSRIMYSEYWGGRNVYRSTNGWIDAVDIQPNINGQQNQGQWVTPFNLNPKNPRTFIIGYQDVFVSFNRGNSFTKISTNLTGGSDKSIRNVDICPTDTNTIFVTQANNLYYTYNYGEKWNKAVLSTSLDISSIEFHPTNVNHVWASRSGLGQYKVQESKDKGKTWKNITGNFPATPALVIRYDEASNALFAGTDIGLFYSDADHINWQYYGKGLPNTSVTDIELHQASRKLYISTYGRGFYSIDLPSCYPAAITISSKRNSGNFEIKDSLQVCSGDQLTFKSNIDSLPGTYRWKGPQNLDTSIMNNNSFSLRPFDENSRSGYYSLEFTSDKQCLRIDSIYIQINKLPTSKILSDYSELDCHHPSLNLSITSPDPNQKYSWTIGTKKIQDSLQLQINQPGLYILQSNLKNTPCFSTDSIRIDKIESPVSEYQIKNVDCYGEKTGTIKLTIKSGTEPYYIQYPDSNFITDPEHLAAGNYIIKIVDSRKCEIIDTIKILQNEEIKANFNIKNSANNDGEINSSPFGGVKPYTFNWFKDGIEISTQEDITNLDAGYYKLIVSDSLGCIKAFDSIEVAKITATNNLNQNGITLYPNPAHDQIEILSETDLSNGILEIYTLDGIKLLKSHRINLPKISKLDLKDLKSGIYLLQIRKGNFIYKQSIEIIK